MKLARLKCEYYKDGKLITLNEVVEVLGPNGYSLATSEQTIRVSSSIGKINVGANDLTPLE